MKSLLLAALLLPSLPALCQMQPPPPTLAELAAGGKEGPIVFRKANAVLVHTTDSSKVVIQKVAKLMLQRGYIVDKMDESLGMVVTKSRTLSKGFSPETTLSAFFDKGIITISSQYTIHAGQYTVSNAGEYSGLDGAANKTVFREAEAIALAYPGGRIGYTRKP